MPNWLKNRVLYQIFPDLFYKPEKSPLHPLLKGYHGGTLGGIISKLDYIQNWGFNAIYINPIFKAVSSHRYNILNFYEIDPILGTTKDFENLICECKKRDIKIILDIPFNHVSDKHEWVIDATNNPNSSFREYFIIEEGRFNRWRNSDLVELNLDNKEVLQKLIFSEDSVLKFWMSKGIDGIRLDCANDLGMKVCQTIRDTAHEINQDFLVMGEVFNYPGEWSNVLDSLQSYYLTGLLFSLAKGEISTHSFSKGIDYLVENCNYEVLLNSLNILSSHDTPRVLEQIGNDTNVYKLLLCLQFTLPGVPVVLYGEEVGMTTGKAEKESSRKAMIWDENKWNKKVMNLYKTFISLRKSRKELQEGKFVNISPMSDYRIIGYVRFGKKREEFSIILVNPTDKIVEKKIFIPYSHFHDTLKVVDYLSGESFICEISSIKIKLHPLEVMVLTPNWRYIKDYSFYKRE